MTPTDHQSSIINHQSPILLCPGQGAQHIGMGKGWYEKSSVSKQVFDAANALLGFSLTDACFAGPEETINRTDVAQPALYVASVASYKALQAEGKIDRIRAAAGLSLGEFTALHLAGAFDFETGLQLVRLRGQAMQDAAEMSRSGMVALVGADEAQADALCEEALNDPENRGDEVLVPANFNCPGQVVISGSEKACERAMSVADKMGLRATMLAVAGAFHSPLMQPAADRLRKALDEADFSLPTLPVLSNVTGQPHESDVASIKDRLVEQLTSPVRWEQDVRWLLANTPQLARFIELAPGKVLSGLMRRIDKPTKVENHAEPSP
ncbi:MAG: ACP S-malonyltransferase [Phycisphaera sp.]|nr:ACP S-malonyltransferase [Phycisphaera sp.]